MNRRNFIRGGLAGGAVLCTTPWLKSAVPPREPDRDFQPRTDVTPYVVGFIAGTNYQDLPADVIELGKKSILDAFGLALVGARSTGSGILRSYFESFGFKQANARVLGAGGSLPLRFAAFANGASVHMEDFDDTQLAVSDDRVYGLLTHPSAPVFPVALGAAEAARMSGRDFLLAYHVGVEVACKLAEACSPRSYQSGFHSTGVFGVFGALAACARLRGYPAATITPAMGLAASQASGLIQNFGTMTKPFHAGHAAEAGVVAADLAALGWTAAENILEGQNGFFHAYGGSYDAGALLGKLGHPWTFSMPGISIKPYPSGSLTHPGMTELERLIRKEDIKAADVEQLEVGTNSQMQKPLRYHRPQRGLEAKFSMEYCLAVLLVAGKAGLGEFTDEAVLRPEVQDMMKRIRFGVDPVAEAAGYARMTTLLRIRLRNGRVVTGRADFAKGSPANPMSFDEVAGKFLGCAAFARWPEAKARQLIEAVRELESLPDVKTLTDLCVPDSSVSA